jgi:hypothetical protein
MSDWLAEIVAAALVAAGWFGMGYLFRKPITLLMKVISFNVRDRKDSDKAYWDGYSDAVDDIQRADS